MLGEVCTIKENYRDCREIFNSITFCFLEDHTGMLNCDNPLDLYALHIYLYVKCIQIDICKVHTEQGDCHSLAFLYLPKIRKVMEGKYLPTVSVISLIVHTSPNNHITPSGSLSSFYPKAVGSLLRRMGSSSA